MDKQRSIKEMIRGYGLAAIFSIGTAVAILPFHDTLHLANIDMVFLLPVLVSATWLGRGPAIFTALVSVALFAYLFVPPRFSLEVKDPEFLITFAMMLVVGFVTAELAAIMRSQTAHAEDSANHSARLYGVARDLAGIASMREVQASLNTYLESAGLKGELHLIGDDGKFPEQFAKGLPVDLILESASKSQLVEAVFDQDPNQPILLVPLTAPMSVRGILIVRPGRVPLPQPGRDRDALRTIASLIGMVVERLHYVEVAQKAQLEMTSERLRASVLTALSHDLRTPMTSIVGLADNMMMDREPLPAKLRGIAETISNRARAVNRIFDNLIKLAQLQSGRKRIRKEWQLFEDVIGSGLRLLEGALGDHPIRVNVPEDMPLVEFDAVLIERVVCNLVENAAKYSPDGAPILISAFVDGSEACLQVRDHGPGFPPGPIERLFGTFVRGEHETPRSGAGLGLAICNTIIEAHGGRIVARNHETGGAFVEVRLPLGTPPAFDPPTIEKESV